MNGLWTILCVFLCTSGSLVTSSWQGYIANLEGQAGGAANFFAGGLFTVEGTFLAWKGSFQPTAEQASFVASVCTGAYGSDIEKAQADGITLGDEHFYFLRREADDQIVYFKNKVYSGMARTSKTVLIIGIDDGTNAGMNRKAVNVIVDYLLGEGY